MSNLAKMVWAAIALFVIVGCTKPSSEWETTTRDLSSTEELNDCKMIVLDTGIKEYLVIRCPNSSVDTSFMQGKVRVDVNTVDENECIKYKEQVYCKDKQ